MSILDIRDSIAGMKGLITVVVNDGTRPSSAESLSALRPVLKGRVRFLFATGTHRPVTRRERFEILGDAFAEEAETLNNVCDDGSHVSVGTTSRGTEVEFHPWILDGPVVALSTVEPHYFAGFTGGRKSFLPGVSSRKTVVQNHFLACFPEALPGRLSGNPVHEDMMEGAALVAGKTEIIMANGVSGTDTVYCGDYDASFFKACEAAITLCGVPVKMKYSSLEVHPGGTLELSLYQAMKAVFLWEEAVEDGGDLVLAAACPEGLGARQMERLLVKSSSAVAVPGSVEEYMLGDHAAIRLRMIRNRINLSFRTGLNMRRFGFDSAPESCSAVIEKAGFLFPVVEHKDA
jgi:nickel-dependent lactate racemase